MPNKAKFYIGAVIASGVAVFAASWQQWAGVDWSRFLLYLALTLLGSGLKLRLPGISGTYSLNFVFVLAGLAHFSLAETALAGCAGALVQCLWRARKRPSAVQVAFSMANLSVSVGACYALVQNLLVKGSQADFPAAMAMAAAAYFVMNTMLVSGVLSLLEGKSLREVSEQWYWWSFPYYLAGAVAVGLIPIAGWSPRAEAWLLLVPPLYLIHFYYGLSGGSGLRTAEEGQSELERLPAPAKIYLAVLLTAGLSLMTWCVLQFEASGAARFAGFLAMAVVASLFKIKLPGMTGAISPGFVVLLVAAIELRFPEAVLIGCASGMVQTIWRSPKPQWTQAFFNLACLGLSTAAAREVSHYLFGTALGGMVAPSLLAATVVLYGCNTGLVAAAVCLAERKILFEVWRTCYFWSFPYYLVGAAAAGLMIATNRTAGWQPALLVMPLMALVYTSYKLHLRTGGQAHS